MKLISPARGYVLPSGDYGTGLSNEAASYWEVEMRGEAPGIDLAATFLVPVYARPQA